MCAPWKINGVRTETVDGEKFSDHRRRFAADTFKAQYLSV